MDRAKVICHMMTTIDGKIVIDWDGNKDYKLAGEEYDRLIYTYAQAYGCGRATSQMDLDVISPSTRMCRSNMRIK